MEGIIEFEPPTLKFTHNGCQVVMQVFYDEVSRRFLINEIKVSSSVALPGDALRSLPLRSMEAFINRRYGPRVESASSGRQPSARLRIPAKGGKKPDTFYRQVAEIYERLVKTTSAPAKRISESNDVPVSTVHRWIKEARARGVLAPGEKGKAV